MDIKWLKCIIFLDLTNIIIIMSNDDFAWYLETDACL